MSRIGKAPITIPQGVTVNIKGNHIEVKGPKGQLALDHNEHVAIEQKDGEIFVKIVGNERQGSAFQGLYNRLIGNMVMGVTQGFTKELEIQGVGYRAKMEGKALSLSLGFSHPINFPAPEGITLSAPQPTQIIVEGIDKQKVGQVAANIRGYRPPEPYKGKGIRYKGEYVRKKVGKSGAK